MKFLAFGSLAAIVLTYLKLKEISKEIMASKTELLAILDRVVTAQADSATAQENIAADVRGLKEQLENAGVDQEIIDAAEAIAVKQEAAAASLRALADETPEADTTEPDPVDPDEDQTDVPVDPFAPDQE